MRVKTKVHNYYFSYMLTYVKHISSVHIVDILQALQCAVSEMASHMPSLYENIKIDVDFKNIYVYIGIPRRGGKNPVPSGYD